MNYIKKIFILSIFIVGIIAGMHIIYNNRAQAVDDNIEVRYVILFQPAPIFINEDNEYKDGKDRNKTDKKEVSIEGYELENPLENMEIFNVTAYTAGYESTGKTPDHPLYGVTASGEIAVEGVTIACPPSMEFGTKIYIPHFDNTFTCQDRGSAIQEGHLDIFMESIDDALQFGRRNLPVKILGVEEKK